MLFENRTGSHKIDLANEFVSKLILETEFGVNKASNVFFSSLLAKTDWKFTRDDGFRISLVLKEEALRAFKNDPVDIKPYRTTNPWSSVLGYSDGKDIFINMRKISSLDAADYVGNLVHEFCHHAGYGHGVGSSANNIRIDTHNKLNSVPYYCGNLARDIYLGKY